DIPWGSSTMAALLVVSALILAAFVWAERRAAEPIVPLGVLATRTLGVPVLVSALMSAGLLSTLLLTPVFIQGVMGHSASQAGAAPALNTFARAFGGTLASAALGGLLSSGVGGGVHSAVAGASPLAEALHQTFLDGVAVVALGAATSLVLRDLPMTARHEQRFASVAPSAAQTQRSPRLPSGG